LQVVDEGWNPWKMTAIAFGLAVGIAVVVAVVVTSWTPLEPVPMAGPPARSSVPPQDAIDACNQQAAQTSQTSKTTEAVQDRAIGAITGAGDGALYGINESRKNDEPYLTAYASCMRTRGYTG
jgi:hypothetical protein